MKLRHLLWVVVLAIAAGGVWYAVTLRNQPPEMTFAHVVRESITSSVPTNGKVEPIEWAEARAERPGPVAKILVQRGARGAGSGADRTGFERSAGGSGGGAGARRRRPARNWK